MSWLWCAHNRALLCVHRYRFHAVARHCHAAKPPRCPGTAQRDPRPPDAESVRRDIPSPPYTPAPRILTPPRSPLCHQVQSRKGWLFAAASRSIQDGCLRAGPAKGNETIKKNRPCMNGPALHNLAAGHTSGAQPLAGAETCERCSRKENRAQLARLAVCRFQACVHPSTFSCPRDSTSPGGPALTSDAGPAKS